MSRSFLGSFLWFVRSFCFVVGCFSFIETAAAADPPKVFTLHLEGFGDPSEVRRQLAEELAVTLVEPERAAEAGGELDVRFEPDTKRVTVRFRKLGDVVTRQVSAAAGEAEARRAAVVLSGNVARDLTAPEATRPAEPSSSPATSVSADPSTAEERRRLDGLERILEHQEKSGRLRTPMGLATLALGAGTFATSFALDEYDHARSTMSGVGVGMVVAGTLLLIPYESPIENTLKAVRKKRSQGEDAIAIEAWLDDRIASERTLRKVAAGIVMGTGAVAVAVGGISVWRGIPKNDLEDRGWSTAMVVGGSLYGLFGLYHFLAPGPLESANELYLSTFPHPQPRVSVRPLIAPTAGGGVIGVTGTF